MGEKKFGEKKFGEKKLGGEKKIGLLRKIYMFYLLAVDTSYINQSVADLGGVGGERFPSRIRPSTNPKGHPLYYFETSILADSPYNYFKSAFGSNIN